MADILTARLVTAAAWAILLGLAVATLGPVSLRPSMGMGAHIERFTGFAILGAAFALAYPRRPILVIVLVVFGAAALEVAQELVAGRHGRWLDFAVKAMGGTLGWGATRLAIRIAAPRWAKSGRLD